MVKRSPRRTTARQLGSVLVSVAPRLLLALVTLAVVVQVSVAGEFRASLPQIALALVPNDAEARARLAGALATSRAGPEAREAARNLARDAINREPLAEVAVRAFASASEPARPSPREEAATLQLMTWAEQLSRRDQATQLWFINYQIRRGDIAQAMRHFDIGLRTSTSARDTIFPVLATAANDRRLADVLVERLRGQPDWKLPFATFLLNDQVSPATAAYIASNALDRDVPEEREVIERLVQRLASIGQYQRSWELYTRFGMDRGKGAATVKDGGFEGSEGVVPFAWSLTQTADLWSAREARPDGAGNVLRVLATSGKSGDAAGQLLRLPPGHYQLSGEFGDVPREAFERPILAVRCAGETTTEVLTSIKPARTTGTSVKLNAGFSVPSSCPFQWLSISVTGPEGADADPAWIDNVAISRSPA